MKDLENIEAYLEGKMSKVDAIRFEEEMAVNPDLQQEVEIMRAIHDATELDIEDDLRRQLDQLAQQSKKRMRTPQIPTWSQIITAASFALLLGLGINYFLSDGQGLKKFTAREYVNYEIQHTRTDNTQAVTSWEKSLTNPDRKDAINALTSYLETNPQDWNANFALADLYYRNKNLSSAKLYFDKVIDGQSAIWMERAQWNRILISVDIWDTRAETILNRILKDPDHSYHQQAVTLQEKLN